MGGEHHSAPGKDAPLLMEAGCCGDMIPTEDSHCPFLMTAIPDLTRGCPWDSKLWLFSEEQHENICQEP